MTTKVDTGTERVSTCVPQDQFHEAMACAREALEAAKSLLAERDTALADVVLYKDSTARAATARDAYEKERDTLRTQLDTIKPLLHGARVKCEDGDAHKALALIDEALGEMEVEA